MEISEIRLAFTGKEPFRTDILGGTKGAKDSEIRVSSKKSN